MIAVCKTAALTFFILFCARTFGEEDALKTIKLAATQESESYKLIKISNSDRIGERDRNGGFTFIDLKETKKFISDDPHLSSERVSTYIATLTNNFSTSLVLINAIKREYDFSSFWTDPKSPINVDSFQKISNESDLNEFLGPIASIPTRVDGVARFNLHHNGEVIQFLGFASKKKFSLVAKYWAYFHLYRVKDAINELNDIVFLVADAPDNSLGYNGTYVLVPKRVLSAEVKPM